MFGWLRRHRSKPSAEQLAVELQHLCDQYDRWFEDDSREIAIWCYLPFLAYAVSFFWGVAAGVAKFGGRRALDKKLYAASCFFWLIGDVGLFTVQYFPSSLSETARALLLKRIEAKRSTLVAVMQDAVV